MMRIGEATFLVRDLDEAIAFFVDALGFRVRQDDVIGPGRRRVVVEPDGGGTGLLLALAPDSATVARQADGDVAFVLHTDDFAAQHERMVTHGVRFLEEPRHEPYGVTALFEDLYGQPWDLIEPS